MKKIVLIHSVLLFVVNFSFASDRDTLGYENPFKKFERIFDDCDACGCSASGGSMGFSSMLNPNFIGVRYFYQSYQIV